MLNEQRIKEQYQLALLDQKEEKILESHRQFYRSDYISKELVRSFFSGTVAYLLITLLILFTDMDKIMVRINQIDYETFAMQYIALYIAFMLLYFLVTYVLYAIRFQKQKKAVKIYRMHLKKLYKLYDKDEK